LAPRSDPSPDTPRNATPRATLKNEVREAALADLLPYRTKLSVPATTADHHQPERTRGDCNSRGRGDGHGGEAVAIGC